ncbi:MAG TPA: hypothetical protein VNW46_17415 [Gemmatimonadaceae bacterium]|jgi:hypothetical protein|nr:hypothetical protein [Gemmatimonadaceae bacterium]
MTNMVRALLLSAFLAAPAAAQDGPILIEPGMSQEQVVARLGHPVVERHDGARTYLTFDNDCGRSCGGDDLVILDNDAVVDAVFRTGRRRYAGTGSATTLTSSTSQRPTPEPIRPASAADSAHRGGIVYMGPRPPAATPKYDVVKPKVDTTQHPSYP